MEHNRSHFVDRFTVRFAQNVCVEPERDSGICVAQLFLYDFWIRTSVEQQARVRVSEGVEATPRDGEQV